MTSKNLFTVDAIICFLFGLALIVIPVQYLDSYMLEGESMGPVARGVARAYGGVLLGIGFIYWINKNATGALRRTLLWGLVIINLIATIAYGYETMSGLTTSLSWSTVVLTTILTLWSAMLLMKSDPVLEDL